ncbi:MAG: hypothetical protein HN975_10775 [Anaerolineae bacterium]|jgi:hypothetical protein|nr:hypothetical protein [Anaerolineae bacterium]
MYAILHYLYRDASNWKTFGEVAFANPDEKTADEISAAICVTLEGGEFFVAESLELPTLYHDRDDPSWADQAHGYHEFERIEIVAEPEPGIKHDNRTISQLIEAFTAESEKNWPLVRDLDAEKPDDADEPDVYIRLFHGRERIDEKLEDWGWNGPVLGPYESIQLTYGTHIKMHKADHFEDLGVVEDLIYYDGYYYGDASIFSSDEPPEDVEEYAYWKAYGNYTREHVLEIARDYGSLVTEAAIAEILAGEYLDEMYHPHRENHPFVKKALSILDKLQEIDITATPEEDLKAIRGYFTIVADNVRQEDDEDPENEENFWELDFATVFDALEDASALCEEVGCEVRCFCVIPGADYPSDFTYMKENYVTVFTLPATSLVAAQSEKEQIL